MLAICNACFFMLEGVVLQEVVSLNLELNVEEGFSIPVIR
jgi:hypothetical protein